MQVKISFARARVGRGQFVGSIKRVLITGRGEIKHAACLSAVRRQCGPGVKRGGGERGAAAADDRRNDQRARRSAAVLDSRKPFYNLLTCLAAVKRLKVIHADQQPLDDNTIEVAHFCRGLEAILRHQQKGEQ